MKTQSKAPIHHFSYDRIDLSVALHRRESRMSVHRCPLPSALRLGAGPRQLQRTRRGGDAIQLFSSIHRYRSLVDDGLIVTSRDCGSKNLAQIAEAEER